MPMTWRMTMLPSQSKYRMRLPFKSSPSLTSARMERKRANRCDSGHRNELDEVTSDGSALCPSAVIPRERNYIINPAHPNFAQLRFATPEQLLRRAARPRKMTRAAAKSTGG